MNTLQAIKKINPNAKVAITQKPNEDEVIEWLDGTAEISQADINAKKSEFDYVAVRQIAYQKELGGWDKQLDMMWHDKQNDTTTWEDAISKIKSDNPKGGS